MNGISYMDYEAANAGVAFAAFFFGVAGAVLSAMWVFAVMRETGPVRLLFTALVGVHGFLNFWFVAVWLTRALGWWEYQDATETVFVWQFGAGWLVIVAMAYALSRLHRFSVAFKARRQSS
jgi:hypothetical protein